MHSSPDQPFAHHALDALRAGNLDRAAAQITQALAMPRVTADTFVLAGMIESQRQQFAEAELHLKRALELNSEHIEALIVLSKVYEAIHRNLEAVEIAEAAVQLNAEDADLWEHLGQLLLRHSQIAQGLFALERSVDLEPTNPRRLRLLADTQMAHGRELNGAETLLKLDKVVPANLQLKIALARVLMMHGRFSESIVIAQQALAIDGLSQPANLLLALALAESARGSEAYTYLRRAVKLNPNDGLAKAALGYWYQEEGRFTESVSMLESAIDLVPDHGFAYYNLLRARKATELDGELWTSLHERVQRPDLPLRDRTYLNYALAKGHEDLGEYEPAMRFYDAGNADAHELWLGHNPWQREAYQEGFTKTIRTFTRAKLDELSQSGIATTKPLIILGMMRSGTSLVEQIVSSHPNVLGAGELLFWHDHEQEAFTEGEPDAAKIHQLGKQYLADIERLGPTARHVTDKLPHNYAMLGLMLSAFPQAKVIHLRRNPVDNCLSIYTTAYQRPPIFAHDKDNIVFAYREYQRMMSHWRSVLSANQLFEIDYEALIADRETSTRRLIDFIGLEWDDVCLRHESNQRAVRTPSLWQVRQPIYQTSVERWRKFEPWIPEFTALQNS